MNFLNYFAEKFSLTHVAAVARVGMTFWQFAGGDSEISNFDFSVNFIAR